MKVIKLIISLILLIPLSSCWDMKEISDIQIVSAIGIDKIEDKYELSFQLVKKYEFQSSPRGETPYIIYSGIGETVTSALDEISNKAPHSMYLGHIQYIVISDEVAKEDMENIFDGLVRNQIIRSDPYIYISKDNSAKDIISILHEVTIHNKNLIRQKSINAKKHSGSIVPKMLFVLQRDMFLVGKELSIPVLNVEGADIEKGFSTENSMSSRIETLTRLDGMAMFVDNKLVGYMTDNEARGLSYLSNQILDQETVIDYNNDCKLTISVSKVDSIIKGNFENGPEVIIDLDVKTDLRETYCDIDFESFENIDKIRKLIEEKILDNMRASLYKAQSVGSDVFGFGEKLRRNDNKKWKEIENNWSEIFKTIPVHIKVKARLRDIGTIRKYQQQN